MASKPVSGADVMEGGESVKGNKGFKLAKEELKRTFNRDEVRKMDVVAMHFLDHHVFAPIKNDKGEVTGRAVLAYTAGCYLSNIELDHVEQLEKDYPDVQAKCAAALTAAGYTAEVVEYEPEAKILG